MDSFGNPSLCWLGEDPCLVIAAHASVGLISPEGQVSKKETAWGAGTRLNKDDSWAMYSVYCLCSDEGGIDVGGGGGDNVGGN